nr:pentatricopeptide repeat protein AaPPR974 [Agave angustifolia]
MLPVLCLTRWRKGRWLHGLQSWLACSVHALLVKSTFDCEPKVAASLVNLYVKCGDLFLARKVFDSVTEKDVFLWTSMIVGYVQGGNSIEALDIFQRLLTSPVKANEVTVAILSACIEFGSLTVGERVGRVC